ncbi:MAG: hypothetical protein V1836_01310 [Candidatus Aenigmatarchaeota archaeon]
MKLAILGIVLAIIVSGCTTTDASTGSNGGSVVIKSFVADSTAIRGNDKVSLSAEIVNTGDSKATAVKVQLLELDVKCDVPSCDATNTQWGLQSGKKSDSISDLRINQRGEEAIPKQYSWRVQAPQLPVGIVQNYQATARVSFGYSTTTIKQIQLVTFDEYQRLKDKGETLPVTTAQPSNGPLGVDVRVNEPVKIEGGSETFMLVVAVTNLAGGNTFLDNDPNAVTKWNLAKLTLALPSGLSMVDSTGDCVALTGSGLNIELSKGKDFKIACEVRATSPLAAVSKTVVVRADYGYFVDAKLATPIEVTGRENYVTPTGTPTGGGATTTTVVGGTSADTEAPAAVSSANFQVSAAIKDPNTAGKWIISAITFTQPSDNKGVTAFDIIVDKVQPTADCGNCASLARITSPAVKNTGDLITAGPANNLDQQSTYYVVVRAKDAAGNIGPIAQKTVQTGQY